MLGVIFFYWNVWMAVDFIPSILLLLKLSRPLPIVGQLQHVVAREHVHGVLGEEARRVEAVRPHHLLQEGRGRESQPERLS